MKSLFAALSAVALIGLSTPAVATEAEYFANLEYQVMAQTTEAKVGVDVMFDNGFTLTPAASAQYNFGTKAYTFNSFSVTGTYDFNDNVAVYGRLEANQTLGFQEVAVGTQLRF